MHETVPFHLFSDGSFSVGHLWLPCHCLSVCTVNKRELIGPTVLDIGALLRIRPNQRGKPHTYSCTYYALRHFVSPIRFVSPITLSRRDRAIAILNHPQFVACPSTAYLPRSAVGLCKTPRTFITVIRATALPWTIFRAGADLGFENKGGRRGCHLCSSVKCGAQTGHSQAKNGGLPPPCAPPLDPRL